MDAQDVQDAHGGSSCANNDKDALNTPDKRVFYIRCIIIYLNDKSPRGCVAMVDWSLGLDTYGVRKRMTEN
eukprot:1188947-Prorocentrum_minimum.AAC.1